MDFFKYKKQSKNADLTKTNSTFTKNLKAYISHYCNSTTIHGVKYIGEKGRYLLEKLVWVCTVIMVCSACTLLVNKTYYKWKTSPVIVSFETKETPIFTIPFPAVTFCPQVKFDPDYFNFTEHFLKRVQNVNETESEEKLFDSILMTCDIQYYYNESFKTESKRKFMDKDFYDELFFGAVRYDYENDTTVEFLGKDVADQINPLFTEAGVCYTFNMLPRDEILRCSDEFITNKTNSDVKIRKWSLEDGYPPGDNYDSYPKRTFMSGVDGGFVIDGLYANHSQLDFLCQRGVQGFKVVLHHPSELPNMDKHFTLPLNHLALIAIKPSMITASKELLKYDPNIRKCYFAKEKYLSLYKLYTQENCLAECLSNFTLKNCGCVSFWMPKLTGTQICGPSKIGCVKTSKIDYLGHNKKDVQQCECLPSCKSLSYNIEKSQTSWNWRELYDMLNSLNKSESQHDLKLLHFSKLVVYYRDLQFLTSRRHELYGVVDFFSNVGGLLGLFMGFSVISVVEVMWFLSLRIICNVKKYGKKLWSGRPDLTSN